MLGLKLNHVSKRGHSNQKDLTIQPKDIVGGTYVSRILRIGTI